MKYCAQDGCGYLGMNLENFCEECGTELTPYIQCLCGQKSFHPTTHPLFCNWCGTSLTEEYLGRCISAYLKGMVKDITERKNLLPLNGVEG